MKKAVLFDLDGTLTNTSIDIWENVNLTMRRFGYPEITLEEAKLFVGNGAVKLIERAIKGKPCQDLKKVVDFYICLCYNTCSAGFVYR